LLKQAFYRCNGYPMEGFPEFNKVAYVIIGGLCYFTGIESENRTSTINAAEEVIMAISAQEQAPTSNLRFFDIQCRSGYEFYFPGQLKMDELVYDAKENSVNQWLPTICDVKIIEMFRQYIGKDLGLKEKYGTFNKFSEGLLAVINHKGHAFHIREDGSPAYAQRYFDVTDFKDGKAWVGDKNTHLWAQIDKSGNIISAWVESYVALG